MTLCRFALPGSECFGNVDGQEFAVPRIVCTRRFFVPQIAIAAIVGFLPLNDWVLLCGCCVFVCRCCVWLLCSCCAAATLSPHLFPHLSACVTAVLVGSCCAAAASSPCLSPYMSPQLSHRLARLRGNDVLPFELVAIWGLCWCSF